MSEQSAENGLPVHWIGDAPTSLHGNGAASFERSTRDERAVTCRLCLSLLSKREHLTNACACGDCYHPVIGPDTDGEPCEWCQDCGCHADDHTRMTRVIPPVGDPPMSETVPMTLTDFLLARIAEDEAVAEAVRGRSWYSPDGEDGYGVRAVGRDGDPVAITSACPEDMAHIARNDPARVLAECEAKRRIVELWAGEWPGWHGFGSGLVRTRMTDDQFLRVREAETVLALLALPYAGHPDYREEWKP